MEKNNERFPYRLKSVIFFILVSHFCLFYRKGVNAKINQKTTLTGIAKMYTNMMKLKLVTPIRLTVKFMLLARLLPLWLTDDETMAYDGQCIAAVLWINYEVK